MSESSPSYLLRQPLTDLLKIKTSRLIGEKNKFSHGVHAPGLRKVPQLLSLHAKCGANGFGFIAARQNKEVIYKLAGGAGPVHKSLRRFKNHPCAVFFRLSLLGNDDEVTRQDERVTRQNLIRLRRAAGVAG